MMPLAVSLLAFVLWCCVFGRKRGWPEWAAYKAMHCNGVVMYFENEPDLKDGYWIDFMDGVVEFAQDREPGEPWIEARPKELASTYKNRRWL